ncbi:MAG: T9SS type A sorting domain-containing protein, partial [Chitinophagaceae bacterium]|nr:T9SS type A sorting domain-containing protein [Chitinophagaceae bacterium]
ARYKILDSTALRTYATNLDTGVYVFRVTVTDNKGAASSDEMKITVLAPAPKIVIPNAAPVANAGADGVATLGWNKHLLNSTLSKDPDGWITSVRWSKVSGPSAFRVVDTTVLLTHVTDLVEGVYTFRVKVTDNKGASSMDDVKITVVKSLTPAASTSVALNSAISTAAQDKIAAKEGITNLSPNPAVNSLQLQYSSSLTGETNISVFDLNGRVVKSVVASKTLVILQQTINIHDLTNGIYYAVARTGNQSYAPVKFIKQ